MKNSPWLTTCILLALVMRAHAGIPALDSANKYFDDGYYSKALKFASMAYDAMPRPINKIDRNVYEVISILGDIHAQLWNYRSAIGYYRELADLGFRTKQPKKDYFETIYYLGQLYAEDGNIPALDSLYGITQKIYPKPTDTYTLHYFLIETLLRYSLVNKAETLNDSLGGDYDNLLDKYYENSEGQYFDSREQARNFLDSLAATRLKEYNHRKDKDPAELAEITYESATQYDSLDFNQEADSLYRLVQQQTSDLMGTDNELYIECYNRRSELKKKSGDYIGAFELIKKAEPLALKTYGSNSVLYGDLLRYTGDYLHFLGRDDEAREYFDRAMVIFRSQLSLVNNLYSALIMDMSSGTDVTGQLNEIIVATEKRGIICNSCYSYLLIMQAKVLEKQGKFLQAEDLYFKAKESIPDFDEDGTDEIDVALADFYVRCQAQGADHMLKHFGHYKEVVENGKSKWINTSIDQKDPYSNDRLERIYDKAIGDATGKYGKLHPKVAALEYSKALLYWAYQPQFETIVQFSKTLKIYLDITKNVFPFLTESERISFYNSNKTVLESFLAYIVSEKLESPLVSSSSHAYRDPGELRKIIGDDSINFTIRRSIDSTYYFPKYTAPGILLNYRLATKGLIYESVSGIRKRILASNDSLLIEKFHTWQSIREMVNGFEKGQKNDSIKTIHLDSLSHAADSLERWLSVQSEDFRNRNENLQVTWKDLLGRMKYNDGAVEVIRCHHPLYYRTLNPAYEDSVYYGFLVLSNIYGGTVSLQILTNGNELESKYYPYYGYSIRYRQEDTLSVRWFWDDLAKTIKSSYLSGRIFFSADGIYNKINLNTLQLHDGSYLIDRYNIHLLSNLKEILEPGEQTGNGIKNSILIGNPDFGNKTSGTETDTTKIRSVDIEDILKNGLESLPGTAREVQMIGNALSGMGWNVTEYEGTNASEANLKKVHSPEILHIATHGYFNDEVSAGNPLYNCGLILSEVGGPEQGTDGNDGIFTGLEAVDLDLKGCRLVVLSACESGLGKVETGEGVYGLQRAFKVANATATLMSLWKVNDRATQELMTLFYKNLGNGMETYSAFKSAQQDLRKKFSHPYYWGAFVLSGI